MKDIVNVEQLAAELGVSPETLRRWIRKGEVPVPPLKIGRSRYWHRKHLGRWLFSQAGKAMWGAR